jgi:GNAT superfamily N-acetyltransferase
MQRRSNGSPQSGFDLRFAEVTAATRADFEALFKAKGGPSYCWCTAWRELPGRREHVGNDAKKRVMTGLIEAGTPVGIIAYSDGRPVGWCSVAPRQTYRRLSRQQDDAEAGIWSIVCFYVPRALRGSGIAAALLDAVVKHAFAKGAEIVEAYPVDQGSPSYVFMGFVDMFAERGFRETGRAGSRRHIMRLQRS